MAYDCICSNYHDHNGQCRWHNRKGASMSTTETKIGKHDVLCSSLNFATPEGAAKCDCNLSVMADMLEALERVNFALAGILKVYEITDSGSYEREAIQSLQQAANAIARAKGGAA